MQATLQAVAINKINPASIRRSCDRPRPEFVVVMQLSLYQDSADKRANLTPYLLFNLISISRGINGD